MFAITAHEPENGYPEVALRFVCWVERIEASLVSISRVKRSKARQVSLIGWNEPAFLGERPLGLKKTSNGVRVSEKKIEGNEGNPFAWGQGEQVVLRPGSARQKMKGR